MKGLHGFSECLNGSKPATVTQSNSEHSQGINFIINAIKASVLAGYATLAPRPCKEDGSVRDTAVDAEIFVFFFFLNQKSLRLKIQDGTSCLLWVESHFVKCKPADVSFFTVKLNLKHPCPHRPGRRYFILFIYFFFHTGCWRTRCSSCSRCSTKCCSSETRWPLQTTPFTPPFLLFLYSPPPARFMERLPWDFMEFKCQSGGRWEWNTMWAWELNIWTFKACLAACVYVTCIKKCRLGGVCSVPAFDQNERPKKFKQVQ